MSRLFNRVAGAATIPPTGTATEVVIAGPKYKFSGQQQIWRLNWATLLVEQSSGTAEATSAYLIATLNPSDPARPNVPVVLQATNQQVIGSGSNSESFAVGFERIDIRADDLPNQGGITLFENVAGGFSIELNFHVWFNDFTPAPAVLVISGSVMAEIVDISALN